MKKILLSLILIMVILLQPILAYASKYTITYNYDSLNRLTSVTYGDGQTIQYTYDPGGNLTIVSNSDTTSSLTVVSANPTNGAINVPVDTAVYAIFSNNIEPGSNIAGISVENGTNNVAHTYSINGTQLTIQPTGNLATSVAYSVYIPSGAVQDYYGDTLASTYSFGFTTQANPSFPVVTGTNPTNNAVNVSVYQQVYFAFNENIQPGGNFSGAVIETSTGTVVNSVYSFANNNLTFTPESPLNYGVSYSVYLPAGSIQGLSGNSLASPYILSFTTPNITLALTTLTLSGNPSLSYSGSPTTFNLASNLGLIGHDQLGNGYNIYRLPVTWNVVSGPATVSGSTLTITGAGLVSMTATVNRVTSNALSLTVTNDVPAISLSPSTLPAAVTGTSYSQNITASGGTSPYTYSVSSGTLPSGLMLDSNGNLSGTITASAGTYNFTVQATDYNNFIGSQSCSLTVYNPLTITTSSLPAATMNVSYSTTLTATGGVGNYTWSATGLPSGLIMRSTGTISGTPTTTAGSPFTVQVTVQDSQNNTASNNFTLTVNAPTITLSPTTLPAATARQSYSQTITASGGTSPYTYTCCFAN